MGRIPPLDPAPSDGVITLRPWRESDVPAMTAACRDGDIQRWTLVPDDYSEELARAFVAHAAASREAGTSLDLAAVDATHRVEVLGCAKASCGPSTSPRPGSWTS